MHQVILCLQMKYINTMVLHHQILILTDDSLTLDSLYQKTSGQITSITARDMKYLARKGEMSQVLSQTLTCGFAWCRWIKNPDHLTFILKRSLMRQVLRDRCSSDFCMYVPLLTVQFNYMYFNFSFQKIRRRKPDPSHCVGCMWCGNSQGERTAIFRHQTTGKFSRYGVFQSP